MIFPPKREGSAIGALERIVGDPSIHSFFLGSFQHSLGDVNPITPTAWVASQDFPEVETGSDSNLEDPFTIGDCRKLQRPNPGLGLHDDSKDVVKGGDEIIFLDHSSLGDCRVNISHWLPLLKPP